ncbi:MAG: hypothetical protein C0616_04120 [Desulfuromonas sp.]|nr:MAG: hypothetical protein C0616_04120 [Desulfuromonas sp.]
MNQAKHYDQETLLLYHYGELLSAERRALGAHLEECAVCRQELDSLRVTLDAVPQVEPQISIADRHRFADEVVEQMHRRQGRHRLAWGGTFISAALLALVLLRPGPELPSVTPPVPAMAEFEVLEKMEMLQDLDVLQDLDLLLELEQLG